MAKRRTVGTTEERIAQAYSDLERATELAFDAQGHEVVQGELVTFDEPDLQAVSRLIELAFKVNGVLTADGKKPAGVDAPIAVQLEELERLLKAAKLKKKESNGKES